MIHVKQAVIVEGRYDKIKLSSIVDGLIISTEGFRIFKDKDKRLLISCLAKTDGIIVFTDSDSAGQQIRNHIKSIAKDGKIFHVYAPQTRGKEKRKNQPSKEGLLGVEGLSESVIEKAFSLAGIDSRSACPTEPITKADFYLDGLSGRPGSETKRKQLMKRLSIPEYLSSNSLLQLLNHTITKKQYKEYISE